MSITRLPILLIGFIFIFTNPLSLLAAEPKINHLKIGVALSGGGARGLAHIGVLEAFEELRVPVDYIAGTSMGSIVGGLYASGLTIEELHQAVEHDINWDLALNYTDNRDQLSYREKQAQRRFIQLELGFGREGLSAPSGFISGQELFMELKRLTRNITIDNFSKLPIPFKTVATDLNTAKPFLLEKGELALALRASMAVPFAFAPVEVAGHLLADGGMVNNIPVEIVRDMGAHIVIAVDITNPLEKVNSSSSFLTVAKQSLNVSLIQNALVALTKADIVIKPEIKEFSITDFDKGQQLILKGYEAVMKKSALFKKLAYSEEEYAQYRATIRAKIPPTAQTITPAFIEFSGNKRTSTTALKRKLNDLVGQELYLRDIKQAANELMSLKEFEQVTYNVVHNAKGKTGLLFDLREKPWGPNYFRLGFNMSSSFDDKTNFLILLRHERLNINRLGAEWINEIEFGTGLSLLTEFYQPLDYHRHFFVAPHAKWERRFVDVFEQQRDIAEYDLEGLRLGVDVGINFGNRAVLRTGMVYDSANTALRVGDSTTFSSENIRENLITFDFGYDSFDERVFAKRGLMVNIEGSLYDTYIGSNANYQKLLFYGRQHIPFHHRFTLISELNFATFFNSTPPEYEGFSVGGFNLLAGYPEGDIGGNHTLLFRLGGLWSSSKLPKLGAIDVRLLGLLHAGNAWDRHEDIQFKDLKYGGLAAMVWETQFGTILLGAGYTDSGSFRYNLSLGQLF